MGSASGRSTPYSFDVHVRRIAAAHARLEAVQVDDELLVSPETRATFIEPARAALRSARAAISALGAAAESLDNVEVGDLCATAELALARVDQRLGELDPKGLAALAACDEARGHLRSAARAIFASVGAEIGTDEQLPTTVRIRARYAELRSAVRDADPHHPGSVRLALLRAADVLETARASGDLAHARSGDRLVLGELRERIQLALEEAPGYLAREVLDDVRATGEMLRRVSEREELRAHDERRLHAAERILREQPHAAPRVALALFANRGLDDLLDEAMDAMLATPNDEHVVESLRTAVSRALVLTSR